MTTPPTFRLRLLGGASLLAPDGSPLSGRATQRHRLALLALLARSRESGVSRDVLMTQLWPESDAARARNLLKVSVYELRQVLGQGAILSGPDGLRLSSDAVDVDVVAFESALARGDRASAVSLYSGPFLEGFFLPGSTEFGQWVDRERSRLAEVQALALESLAEEAEGRQQLRVAVDWWKARAAHDPYDSRVALRLMKCLLVDGNRGVAIRHARAHARLLAEELGIEAPPEILALLETVGEERSSGGGASQVADIAPSKSEIPSQVDVIHRALPARAASSVSVALGRRSGLAAAVILTAGVAIVGLVRTRGGDGGRRPDTGPLAEEIAEAVVREMGGAPDVRPKSLPTSDVSAWELYREASRPEVYRSDSAAREALMLFRNAIELDPGFAGAHAGAARLYYRVAPPEHPDMSVVERLRLARHHATIATELDTLLAEAYGALGLVEMHLYRFGDAEAHLGRARELDPAQAQASEWLVQLYVFTGRLSIALEEARRAVEVDPLSASAQAELGRTLMLNGRCDESLDQVVPLVGLRAPVLRAGPIAAECYAQRGMWDQALNSARVGFDRSGRHGRAWLGHFLARSGRVEEANAILSELRERSDRTGSEAFEVAIVLAGLGRVDEAFEWLERSVDDYSISFELREPGFSQLHSDSRFGELFDRMERLTP